MTTLANELSLDVKKNVTVHQLQADGPITTNPD